MKTYEVRLGSSEGESTAPFNGKSFRKLSDASAQMKRIVAMLQDDNSLISDDLGIWIIRKNARKNEPGTQTELVQMLCGLDEDTNEFCYEGIYHLTACTDFERMILIGEKKGSWLGDYSVQIASQGVSEVCFFSDLEMILESVKDLKGTPDQIRNRLLTIYRRVNDKEAEPIALFLYTLKDGELVLQSRVNVAGEDRDFEMLDQFILSEQNLPVVDVENETAEEAAEKAEEAALKEEAEEAEEAAEETKEEMIEAVSAQA